MNNITNFISNLEQQISAIKTKEKEITVALRSHAKAIKIFAGLALFASIGGVAAYQQGLLGHVELSHINHLFAVNELSIMPALYPISTLAAFAVIIVRNALSSIRAKQYRLGDLEALLEIDENVKIELKELLSHLLNYYETMEGVIEKEIAGYDETVASKIDASKIETLQASITKFQANETIVNVDNKINTIISYIKDEINKIKIKRYKLISTTNKVNKTSLSIITILVSLFAILGTSAYYEQVITKLNCGLWLSSGSNFIMMLANFLALASVREHFTITKIKQTRICALKQHIKLCKRSKKWLVKEKNIFNCRVNWYSMRLNEVKRQLEGSTIS